MDWRGGPAGHKHESAIVQDICREPAIKNPGICKCQRSFGHIFSA